MTTDDKLHTPQLSPPPQACGTKVPDYGRQTSRSKQSPHSRGQVRGAIQVHGNYLKEASKCK